MIDFSKCEEYKIYKGYGGGNGNKIAVKYNGKKHMLKFNSKNDANTAYINSSASEYLACHIFESLGFEVQKTYLGIYTSTNSDTEAVKIYDVVACEDFNQNGYELTEFAALKNTCISSSKNGYGIELDSVLDAIDEQKFIDPVILKEFFWDMFIADAFVGNFDRHNGNWGILVNEDKQETKLAPVYDCGSCLYPQLLEKDLDKVINSSKEINQRVFTFPNSALRINNNKINYFNFISSLSNEDCNTALAKIQPKIKLDKINDIIDNTPDISDKRKLFYKTILEARKEKILDYSLTMLHSRNYSTVDKAAKHISRALKSGLPLESIQKEALKYLPGDSLISKKLHFKTALKEAAKDLNTKKLIQQQDSIER